MRPVSKDRKPTWTSKVEEALRLADDFMGSAELQAKLGANANQINAALWWLRRCGVVESVESMGRLHWFYKGHETDPRIRIVEERRPEDKPRKARVRRNGGGSVSPLRLNDKGESQ